MKTSHFSLGLQRISRTPYQSAISLLVISLVLYTATIFFLDATTAHKILRYFETRPQVNAFFQQDIIPTPQQVDLIKTKLEATGLVESIKYVSKEDALRLYKELNKSDPLLLEAVTSNMLPASIEVSTKNPESLAIIVEQLKQEPGIEDVNFAKEIIESLIKWTNSVRTTRVTLAIIQIFITFIVTLSVLSVRVTQRKEEITTLQLIGATPGYINAPFIIEGILYCVLASFLAWGAAYLTILYSTPFFVGILADIPGLFPSVLFMLEILGGEMALGALIGGLGGLFAVGRFLKA